MNGRNNPFLREFGEAFLLFAFALVVMALFILLDN